MKTKYILAILALLAVMGFAPNRPALLTINLNPGESVTVHCSTSLSANGSTVLCAPLATATATVAPTATNTLVPPTATSTSVPPTDTPTVAPSATVTPTASGCCAAFWHAPDGNHEHGDAPPDWVNASAFPASFTWVGNTPNENSISTKHSAFKGFAVTLNGVDVYLLVHFDVNPGGHASRFHSYQFWMRDPSGGVSYIAGWMDFGPTNTTQTGPNLLPRGCGLDESIRPVIFTNVQTCPDGSHPSQLYFEVWYNHPAGHLGQAGWMPDFGLFSSATYYDGGDPSLPSTWIPTGGTNLTRNGDVSWYGFRDSTRGDFYSTQFGVKVSGPTDPICGTPYTVGSRTYTQVCIHEYIAPSAVSIQFPGNSFPQKTYPGVISLPN